jgi:hypothetical protein
MKEFHSERFFGQARSAEFYDIAFSNCSFEGCTLQTSPGQPNDIRNIRATDVSQENCSVSTAIVDDVVVHNLKRMGDAPLFLWACVFRHVVLSGAVSAVKINRSIGLRPEETARLQPAWDAFTRNWYESVDWAIDISKAKFAGGFSLEAVPGEKVRRDPATQVLVRRSALADPDWRKLDYDGTPIKYELAWFQNGSSQFDSIVLVARTVGKWAKRDVAVLEMLRRHGIADPD